MEVKGKTLEEIDALFEGEHHSSVPDIEILLRGKNDLNIEFVGVQVDSDLQSTNIRQPQAAAKLRGHGVLWCFDGFGARYTSTSCGGIHRVGV